MMKIDTKLYELYKKFGGGDDLNIVFYATNQPIPYKNLLIYPIETIYYMFFHELAEVFFANKYDTGIDETLTMKNLEFLFYQNKEHNIDMPTQYLQRLECLLLLCLHESEFQENGNRTITFFMREKECFFTINNIVYNWRDYDKIKSIICEQNSIELPDYRIHPNIRKKLADKERLLAKINKRKIGTFEELVDSLMLASGYSEEYILELSIRRFTNLLKRYDIMKNYELMTIISPNLDKKDVENIIAWNGNIPTQDQYLSKVTNIEDINSKINQANNQ